MNWINWAEETKNEHIEDIKELIANGMNKYDAFHKIVDASTIGMKYRNMISEAVLS